MTTLPLLTLILVAVAATSCSSPRSAAMPTFEIHGSVAPGFELVRTEFVRNFLERNEIGAACCIYINGEAVVDLWGGVRNSATGDPWQEDTLACVFSTTKGMAAAAMVVAHARGLYKLDDPVARYWPEFAQNGKSKITVRQLLAHTAGLSVIDEKITVERITDVDRWAKVLARQSPQWDPGKQHGYHGLSLGFYENELIRRIDPQRRSIGAFFREEVAKPLQAEFYIGVPESLPKERIATIAPSALWEMFLCSSGMPLSMLLAMAWPGSLTHRSLANIDVSGPGGLATRDWIRTEFPSATGVGGARGLSRVFCALASADPQLDLNSATFEQLIAPASVPPSGVIDAVLKVPMAYSFGFLRPCETFPFNSSASSFGASGAGGSIAFGDPVHKLGFAYVMNRMGTSVGDDPRARALIQATYKCLAFSK